MDTGTQIKNAYAVLKKAFSEIAALINDFEAELVEKGFESDHSDSGVGAEVSKSLNNPESWIFRYITRYFKRDEENLNRHLTMGIGVVYFKDKEPITPKFLMGIMISNESTRQTYDYWWLSSMYRAKEDLKYINLDSGDKVEDVTVDECWYEVIAEGSEFNERWYDRGYLYVEELTDIKRREDIAKLANVLDIKYHEVVESSTPKPNF